jgi:hypothetical protein
LVCTFGLRTPTHPPFAHQSRREREKMNRKQNEYGKDTYLPKAKEDNPFDA